MEQKNEIEKVFNHFYPGFMSFSERMADPTLKNVKKEISPEVFMNVLIATFNLGVKMSADNATCLVEVDNVPNHVRGVYTSQLSYVNKESILKLLIK